MKYSTHHLECWRINTDEHAACARERLREIITSLGCRKVQTALAAIRVYRSGKKLPVFTDRGSCQFCGSVNITRGESLARFKDHGEPRGLFRMSCEECDARHYLVTEVGS